MPDSLKTELMKRRLTELLDEPIESPSKLPRQVEAQTPGGAMRVPRAHPFQPYPEVIGNSELANQVDLLMRFAPALQGHIKSVQYGPTEDLLYRAQADADSYGLSPVLGVTNMDTKRVSLNDQGLELNKALTTLGMQPPAGPPNYLPLDVLAHEFAHGAGYGHDDTKPEDEAYETGHLVQKLGWGPSKTSLRDLFEVRRGRNPLNQP